MTKRQKTKSYDWLVAHVGHKGRECLLWPFSVNGRGYGHLGLKGRVLRAHRLILELSKGPPPNATYQAAHSCGVRNCVNPNHLSWKTNGENQQDKRRHGTHFNGGLGARTNLSRSQIAQIRGLRGRVPQDEVAKSFGISRGRVQYWQRTNHDPAPPGTSPAALYRQRKKSALLSRG
jgi:hypothetical protein